MRGSVATAEGGRLLAGGPRRQLSRGEVVARRVFDSPAGPAVVAGVVAAGTVFIAMNNPHEPGALGYCPLYYSTGLWCPGCGGSRAVYDLAHGDFAGAMTMNPVFTLAVPLLAVLWVRWLLFTRGRPTKPWNLPEWSYVAIGLGLVAFAVLRNIPVFEPYLAP